MNQPPETPPPVAAGDLDWSEVADAVWLARVLGPASPLGHPARPEPPEPPEQIEPHPPAAPSDDGSAPPEVVALAPAEDAAGRSPQAFGLGTHVNSVALFRAMRPLARRVPSRTFGVLDEEGVAIRAAETGVWWPVLRPEDSRLLDAVLIVDASQSMALWRRTATSFYTLLTQLGAFRDVRLVRVDTDEEHPTEYTTPERAAGHSLAGLLDPTGRRVLFVLTDGVGRAWRPDVVSDWLPRLGRSCPVVVINVLPQRLWRFNTEQVRLAASSPATPNRRLRWQPIWPPDEFSGDELPVPVLELAGPWLSRWAKLLMATGPVTVELPALLVGADAVTELPAANLSAGEAVRQFHLTASTPAFRLVSLLSALPVTMPVIAEVRQAMVPDADQSHVAEVLLSGLLRPTTGTGDVEFEFTDGVRGELLSALGRVETVQVVQRTARRFKVVRSLLHAINAPESAELPDNLNYIEVQEAVFRALSGRYAPRAGRLRRKLRKPYCVDDMAPISVSEALTSAQAQRWEGGVSIGPESYQSGAPIRSGGSTIEVEAPRDRVDAIRALFDGEDNGPVVLAGERGSALALDYTKRFRDGYDFVWWLPAHEPAAIVATYRELAVRHGMVAVGAGGQASFATARANLAGRWLVILDGAGEPATVQRYLPEGGDILVTSNDPDWSRYGQVIDVGDAIPEHELAPDGPATTLLNLCAVLGSGALTNDYFTALTDLPDSSREQAWQELTDAGVVLADHPRGFVLPASVRSAVLDRLDDESVARLREIATDLVAKASAPVGELLSHIRAIMDVDSEPARRLGLDAVTRLVDTGDPDNASEFAESLLRAWTPTLGPNHPDVRAARTRLGVALRVLGSRQEALRLHQSDEGAALHLVRSLRETGKIDAAVALCRTLHDKAPDVRTAAELAASLRLAAALRTAEIPGEAFHLQEEVVRELQERLGDRHPRTLMAVTDLALTRCLRGDTPNGTRTVESVLRVAVGAAHPFTLACGAVVSSELFNAGDYQAALWKDRSLAKKAADAWGADHPATLALRLNVTQDLGAANETGEPDDALSPCQQLLGLDHPIIRLATMNVRAWYDPDPPAWCQIEGM